MEPSVTSKNSEPVTVHHSGSSRRNSVKRPSRFLSSYLSSRDTPEDERELPVVEGGETLQLSSMEDRWIYQGPNFLVDFSTEDERTQYEVARKDASRAVGSSLGHFSGSSQGGTIRRIFSGSFLSSYLNSRRSSDSSVELPRESTPPLKSLEDRWIYHEFNVYASKSKETFCSINEPSTSKGITRIHRKNLTGLVKSSSTEHYDEESSATADHQSKNKPKSKRSVYSASLLSSFLSSKSPEGNQNLPSVEGKEETPFFATLEDRWVYHGLNLLADLPVATISPRIAGRTNHGDEYIIRNGAKGIIFIVMAPKDAPVLGSRRRDGQKLSFGVATHSFIPSFDIHVCENWSIFSRIPSIEGEVKLGPDMKLGDMAGDIDSDFHLKSTTGEDICNIKLLEMTCCPCDDRSYQVVPASSPNDLGGIALKDSKLFVTFPTSLDIPGRALLLACSIIIQYQIEEVASGSYAPIAGD
ncbi:uncharacterized protein [Macrobrachium rosenbergii]|uniref:uncharacterized protein n=1 Tax=Macrobrachium rosenbergii TaxID=79674 RepID=UPI0034D3DE07